MKIRAKQFLENQEARFLAPYAMKSVDSQGRKHAEQEPSYRTLYQRDRDRILYCTAFRRLQYKTQVFVNHEGDHFRTRLTHTLETSQLSQTIARVLGLNEDLTIAIALAHDLGHGPFGHAGEWALEEKMKKHGGFEHNQQCLRIVELLEASYPDFPGLNLTRETIDGLKKHPERFEKTKRMRFRTLEADVVDLADEITYSSHDLDDGLRSGLISEKEVESLDIWQAALKSVKRINMVSDAVQRRKVVIREMMNMFVTDVVETTLETLEKMKITSVDDLQSTKRRIVQLSDLGRRRHAALKRFLMKNLYQHYRVIRMTDKGQRFITALFEAHLNKPKLLPLEVLNRSEREGLHRAICDYIAGMTDRFAMDEYKRLFEPYETVF